MPAPIAQSHGPTAHNASPHTQSLASHLFATSTAALSVSATTTGVFVEAFSSTALGDSSLLWLILGLLLVVCAALFVLAAIAWKKQRRGADALSVVDEFSDDASVQCALNDSSNLVFIFSQINWRLRPKAIPKDLTSMHNTKLFLAMGATRQSREPTVNVCVVRSWCVSPLCCCADELAPPMRNHYEPTHAPLGTLDSNRYQNGPPTAVLPAGLL